MSKKLKLQIKESLSLIQVLLITFILVIFISIISFLIFELLQNKILSNFSIFIFQQFFTLITTLPNILYINIKLIINNIQNIITAAILIIIISIGILEWRKDEILIKPFHVSDELAKKGYTSKIITQKLVDQINLIKSSLDNEVAIPPDFEMNDNKIPDLQIPTTTISIYSLVQYFKKLLNIEQKYLSGEIEINKNHTLKITIRYGNKLIYYANNIQENNIQDELLKKVEEILKDNNPYVYSIYCGFIKKEKDIDNAISTLRDAIVSNTIDQSDAYWLWGTFLNLQSKYSEAIEKYTNAIRLNPMSAKSYINLGTTYQNLGDYYNAIKYYNKALALKRTIKANMLSKLYNNFGVAYEQLKEYDIAKKYYIKAIKLDPTNFSIYTNLGLTYKKLQKYNIAIKQYNNAILLNPHYSRAYNNLGDLYYELEQYDTAIQQITKALSFDLENSFLYCTMGEIYTKTGKYTQAIKNFKKAFNLEKSNKEMKKSLIKTIKKNLITIIDTTEPAIATQAKNLLAKIEKLNP